MLTTLLLFALFACEKKEETPPPAEAPKADAAEGDVPAPPDVAAPPADAQKTASGLAYKVLTPGTGTAHPAPQDTVEVNYTGWTTDGKMFDSSTKRKKTAKFPLKAVIPGWTEGMQLMVVGEKTRFWIPEALAYAGKPGKPQGMLVFDVELVSIKEGPKPIPAPEDVAAAPADAKKTKSGLAYKVLQKGTGKDHPKADSRVTVDYTGWTTDGTMFDSSVARGKPATFGLGNVIPGWTEGVQLMVVGEKTRFWIPADLAYGETPKRPGAPAGMLVFDIELKEIGEAGPGPLGGGPAGKGPRPGPGNPKRPATKGE
ncbi:MAG: FKBP-type peptidyl-prolyl cis-trans isomerase [Myxococcota bacterium]